MLDIVLRNKGAYKGYKRFYCSEQLASPQSFDGNREILLQHAL